MNSVPTYARRLTKKVDPLAAFAALTENGTAEGSVLFETADAGHGSSRSLLLTRAALTLRVRPEGATISAPRAVSPNVLERLAAATGGRLAAGELAVEFEPAGESDEPRLNAPAFDVLRAFATTFEPSRRDLDIFALGAFSFELIDHVESLPNLDRELDDVVFSLPQELIVIDHAAGDVNVVQFDFEGLGEFACGRRIAEVVGLLENLPAAQVPVPGTPAELSVEATIGDHAFGGMVETARRHIVDGDVFQVVLSRGFRTPCDNPMGAYRALRRLNPSPYMFYFGGEDVLFGASPETSLRVISESVEIRPIAGTRRRGLKPDGTVDHDLDTRIEAELRLDPKEVAEHMMLVDLARNDVSRVSVPGTRRVDRLMGVDRYSTVMHLVSHVQGTLRPELDALHAYAAAMNMGTLTGAPKVRATELLRELEREPRGYYGGAVGYITDRGHFDTAIVIRSATVRDGVAEVRAGAGIVHDSDPASEADETRRKANSVLHAIAQAEAGQ